MCPRCSSWHLVRFLSTMESRWSCRASSSGLGLIVANEFNFPLPKWHFKHILFCLYLGDSSVPPRSGLLPQYHSGLCWISFQSLTNEPLEIWWGIHKPEWKYSNFPRVLMNAVLGMLSASKGHLVVALTQKLSMERNLAFPTTVLTACPNVVEGND